MIGDNTTVHRTSPTPTASFGGNRTALSVSVGPVHTCALLSDGNVSCWGFGNAIGNGNSDTKLVPTQTEPFGLNRTAIALSAGFETTCALLSDGNVSCWGSNSYGQVGDGSNTQRLTPTQVSPFGLNRTAVEITSGFYFNCAILDDGNVSCWGANGQGQIGDGTTSTRWTPTQTTTLGQGRSATSLSTNDGQHVCAILDDDSVVCWGRNYYGQLGISITPTQNGPASTPSYSNVPTRSVYANPNGVAANISTGGEHTCAIDADGLVTCWGFNYYGALGVGTLYSSDGYVIPVFVPVSPAITQIQCPIGTFQDQSNQSACTSAEAGHYVPLKGSDIQFPCVAGTYQPSIGQATCLDSDAGYYVESGGQPTQTPCAAGTYNPDIGSSDASACLDADAGHYVATTGQSAQTACSAGAYQPST
ncbi:MAG: hypothetical protein VW799_11085, partial [Halieaceae bacterium]